ncbi:MAG: PepSY domain-containing protein [Flavobacteriales bacterium]|nr:PepSY domain-containing protein [Flavobacteriales bacterium]
MKKVYLLLLSLILLNNLFAQKHNHTDENDVRYHNHNQIDKNFQQNLRNSDLWQNFVSNNADWFVIFNEGNQLPHRAFGKPILVNNFQSFLSDNNFNIPSDLRQITSVKNDKYITENFVQHYNNLEVIGSNMFAKFNLNNHLVSFGLDVFNDIDISTNPSITSQEAIESAKSLISNPIANIIVQNELKVLAIKKYKKYDYSLIYQVNFSTNINEGPANYICYVDAHNGELLMRKNTILYEAPQVATSTVSGDVYTTNPYDPAIIENFKYLKAIDQNSNTLYYTDNNGEVVLPMNIGTQVRYKLEGLYANVETNASTPDIFQNLATSNSVVFDNSNSTIQERSAYQAVNNIHDHLKTVFPAFNGLDNPMETNIDVAGSCNAFFDGSSINFYAEGGGCHNTAKIVDVVYHEYGHAINSGRYNSGSGMWNGGLNEGFADVWALSLTETPVLGYGWDLVDPTISVRRYDQNRKVYPQDLVGEVHADGEIIAGAFWDLYLNLGSMTQMLDLFKYVYDSGVDGPDGDEGSIYTDILLEVLYADDNDGDLSNGTPNDNDIIDAFNQHGITLLSNAVISHNPVTTSNPNVGITINANIGMTYPWALGATNCFYRVNDVTNWTTLTMTGTTSFTTTIPAQLPGTIVAYYISLLDNYGNESGVTPMASNLLPITNANLPNFVLVGYEMIEEEDFDFNFGFWQTGSSDDNATTGLWEIGTPIGSYTDNGDNVQTDEQHTIGGFQCAYTGNASSSASGIGENDVDGGHTTLFSPYYDLSDYTNPAFSYWRWFTNNTGANPGADWWQVLITDDGSNWEYVENNLTSDISWRKFAFRVKDYVSVTNNIQLKFIASDSLRPGQNLDGGSLIEAAVDDLKLYESLSTSTSLNSSNVIKPRLIKITDLLGRNVRKNNLSNNTSLIYFFDDGSTQKVFVND